MFGATMCERLSCTRGWVSGNACCCTLPCCGRSRSCRELKARVSVQVEIDFDRHLNLYRVTVFHPRLEAPSLDRLKSLFIQSHAQGVHHPKIGGTAVGINHNHQSANTLILGFASFLGELRIGRVDWPRRSHSPAGTENAATHAHAFARPNAPSVS